MKNKIFNTIIFVIILEYTISILTKFGLITNIFSIVVLITMFYFIFYPNYK